jgi:glycosyltransferase involved in cell wall biosynthesis
VRLVAYTDNVELGGADLCMSHLLARLDSSIEVTVLGVSPAIVERLAKARPTATPRVVPRPRSDHDVWSLAAHIKALLQISPDIVHANLSSPWSCQYAVAASAVVRRARVVAVYQLAVPPISERQRRAKQLTARAIDRHVGVGERTSRDVEALLGLAEGRVRTIHNGVPDEPERPRRPRLHAGPVIGAIGRLEHQKGFDTLLSALRDVDDATLVLVGEGSDRAALETLGQTLGVSDRVVWTGWSEDPRGYFGSFDVFALPSRFEGFPLVVLEALLAGSAVVAANVGDVADVVLDGETGILVEPDDPAALAEAIRRLLGDAPLRRRLGEQGRSLVLERFTADHMTVAFEALYDELR